jgi:hypothetical protein
MFLASQAVTRTSCRGELNVLAPALGLSPRRGATVWGLRTEGVLAIDQALNDRQPLLERVVALGGSAIREPVHLRVPLGYPIEKLLAGRVSDGPRRVIDGGILNGETVGEQQLGLGAESGGLTVLLEPTRRELWGFVRTGLDRISYSNCFMSLGRRGHSHGAGAVGPQGRADDDDLSARDEQAGTGGEESGGFAEVSREAPGWERNEFRSTWTDNERD